MMRHLLLVLLAVVFVGALTACVPPSGELIPPVVVRVDASYPCDETATAGPDRCVFWRTSEGKVFYGPFSMVRLPPAGTDTIIPPPVVEPGGTG